MLSSSFRPAAAPVRLPLGLPVPAQALRQPAPRWPETASHGSVADRARVAARLLAHGSW